MSSKREIKKLVLRQLAAEMDGGSIDWASDLIQSEDDERRVTEVLAGLADEFSRRGGEFAEEGTP